MVILYRHRSGAGDFQLLSAAENEQRWADLRTAAVGLLEARGNQDAAQHLTCIPFQLSDATNVFGDDFTVLHATIPLTEYVKLAKLERDEQARLAMRCIAEVLTEIGPFVRFVALCLDTNATEEDLVPSPEPRINANTVAQALQDAQHLLNRSGPASAVDRVHTALHGYMLTLCNEAGIQCEPDQNLTGLFKKLREQHHGLQPAAHSELTDRLARAMSTIVDAVNTVRNRASIAHPNERLLDEPEAILVINCVRTIFTYLNAKTKSA